MEQALCHDLRPKGLGCEVVQAPNEVWKPNACSGVERNLYVYSFTASCAETLTPRPVEMIQGDAKDVCQPADHPTKAKASMMSRPFVSTVMDSSSSLGNE